MSRILQLVVTIYWSYLLSSLWCPFHESNMKNFVIYSILTLIWKILRIFIYWLKVKWTSNCILKECCENITKYNDSLKTSCQTWVDRILFEDFSVKQWRRLLKRDYWIFIEVKYIFVFYKFSKSILYQHFTDNFSSVFKLVKLLSIVNKKELTNLVNF